MKTVNKITTGALALMAVLFLDACSKTKNSTPTTNAGQQVMCTTGSYTTITGQQMPCQIGSYVNTAFTSPTGWNGGSYPNGVQSCQQYSQYYGVQYVPVQNNGVIDCYRYDVISQYAGGSSYANYGPEYYYYYPPQGYDYPYSGAQYASGAGIYVGFNFNF